jgi:ceramide glucosyltransferase
MTSDLAYQPLGPLSFGGYFKRRARWTRIRKYAVPVATIAEIASESIVNGICGAYAFSELFGVSPSVFLPCHFIFWFLQDIWIGYCLNPDQVQQFVSYTLAWLVREVFALHLYFYAVAGATVEWRGTMYKLNPDGSVLEAARSESGLQRLLEWLTPTSWLSSSPVEKKQE